MVFRLYLNQNLTKKYPKITLNQSKHLKAWELRLNMIESALKHSLTQKIMLLCSKTSTWCQNSSFLDNFRAFLTKIYNLRCILDAELPCEPILIVFAVENIVCAMIVTI